MTHVNDPHASKISPDDPRLRPQLPKSRYTRKVPAVLAIVAVSVLTTTGVIMAVAPHPKKTREEDLSAHISRIPSEILDSPDFVPVIDTPQEPGRTLDAVAPAAELQKPKLYEAPLSGPALREPAADRGPYSREGRRKQRIEDYWRARSASVFAEAQPMPRVPRDDAAEDADAASELTPQAAQALAELSPEAAASPPNDVADSAVGKGGDGYLHARLRRPRSPYEVKAGTIIPAVLQTAINSDLPGPVFAKVRENVYDSITHEHLLIPQNATLVADYDPHVIWGQERVMLCWRRLILPNGSSIQLECMPGGDLTGASGLTDEVDEHWVRLAKGAALASLLSAATTAAAGDTTGYYPTVPQQFARGAASEFGRAGEGITRRELTVKPTITVRAGWSMNVLVTKDMILEPYRATPGATSG